MFDPSRFQFLSDAAPKFVSFVKSLPEQLDDLGRARDAVMKTVSPAAAAVLGKAVRRGSPWSVHAATFSSGFVVGAVSAAFLTPMTGSELRETIRGQVEAWWSKLQDDPEAAAEEVSADVASGAEDAAVRTASTVHDLERETGRVIDGAAHKLHEVVEGAASKASETVMKAGSSRPLEELTKDELYERAQALGIEGRSNMNRAELIEHLDRQLN